MLLVTAQATSPLLPTTIGGDPGRVTPATRRVRARGPAAGQTNTARYQTLGTPRPRCRSLASSAPPVAERRPATAQALLAARCVPAGASPPRSAATAGTSAAAAARGRP